MRLDMTFLGKPPDPIRVKNARKIASDATWSTLRDDLIFIATAAVCALVTWFLVALMMAVTP